MTEQCRTALEVAQKFIEEELEQRRRSFLKPAVPFGPDDPMDEYEQAYIQEAEQALATVTAALLGMWINEDGIRLNLPVNPGATAAIRPDYLLAPGSQGVLGDAVWMLLELPDEEQE